MKKILGKKFFERPVVLVAQDLLGKSLGRKIGNKEMTVMIVETEAYDGSGDRACHASKGRTKRTEVMFGPAGHFYIYLCYGMYWMLNIVTGQKGYPAAVLIRGVEGKRGPGRLTKYLKINEELNAQRASLKTGLWFEDRGVKVDKKDIKKTPRIGVSYAGARWSKKPYRFVLRKYEM